MNDRPQHLRVEHLDDAFGIMVRAPRLSWWLPALAREQQAYEVQCRRGHERRESGWVESGANVLVPWAGPALRSRDRVEWRVRVRTDLGVSRWSGWARFEVGLLTAGDWSARLVAPHEPEVAPVGERPAHLLRTRFTVDTAPGVARVYATAHGIYELYLDGARVGDLELTPGFTAYRAHLQVQTYDVTAALTPGEHELWAVVSDGWYRGQLGFARQHDAYGESVALLAQVECDGAVVAATGSDLGAPWEHAIGAIVAADLIAGEHVDQRVDAGALHWQPVAVSDAPLGGLCTSPAPPVRRVEQLRPRSVVELAPAHHVVDLGINVNGWVRLRDPGPRDTEVVLTHGEALDASGDVTMDHLMSIDISTLLPVSAGQVDRVVSDGSGRAFEPRHTTHGFQYVRVEGHPGPLTPDDVTGVVVHTDLRRTGWFACSDPDLERLHEAAVWSFRGNACDIPTDCPTRERSGWTGDWQLYAPTASFLYDVAGMSDKYLRDLAADQRPDGVVRNVVPDADAALQLRGLEPHAFRSTMEGSSGWGDAAVLVPWHQWQAYGDREILARQWDSAVAWLDFATRAAREGRHARRIAANPEPLAHEEFLWDTGYHWGEWLEPDVDATTHFLEYEKFDPGPVATAYLAHSAATLARIAELLDRDEDAARYDELAAQARHAWCTEFVGADGRVTTGRQADCVRALAFHLVPDDAREPVVEQLVQLVHDAGTHVGTGFLATPDLLPVLADHGHVDVAYELLFQRTEPSWLVMLDRGATTIWEGWNGIDADGVPHESLNHYSKGAVISFLHRHVAGLRPIAGEPAYRRFAVAPQPGGGITWASAALDSPRGRIEVHWTISGGTFRLEVTVPPGTVAEVRLPSGECAVVGPGRAVFTELAA
jgi:alpha-L-rhamnosidase